MKYTNYYFVVLLISVFSMACSNTGSEEKDQVPKKEKEELKEDKSVSKSFSVDATESMVEWAGGKEFVDWGHNGTLAISAGNLEVKNGQITSGTFNIDMTSLSNEDLKDSPEDQQKLLGHLMSPDFFNVEAFPNATVNIIAVKDYSGESKKGFNKTVKATLTIKGISKEIEFPAQVEVTNELIRGRAIFEIDRSEWDIQYGSSSFFPDLLKDKIIKNAIDVKVKFVAS